MNQTSQQSLQNIEQNIEQGADNFIPYINFDFSQTQSNKYIDLMNQLKLQPQKVENIKSNNSQDISGSFDKQVTQIFLSSTPNISMDQQLTDIKIFPIRDEFLIYKQSNNVLQLFTSKGKHKKTIVLQIHFFKKIIRIQQISSKQAIIICKKPINGRNGAISKSGVIVFIDLQKVQVIQNQPIQINFPINNAICQCYVLQHNIFCIAVNQMDNRWLLKFYKTQPSQKTSKEFLKIKQKLSNGKSGTTSKINKENKIVHFDPQIVNSDTFQFKVISLDLSKPKYSCPFQHFVQKIQLFQFDLNELGRDRHHVQFVLNIWEIRPYQFYVKIRLNKSSMMKKERNYLSLILYCDENDHQNQTITLHARPAKFQIYQKHVVHFCSPVKMEYNDSYQANKKRNQYFNVVNYFVNPNTEEIFCRQKQTENKSIPDLFISLDPTIKRSFSVIKQKQQAKLMVSKTILTPSNLVKFSFLIEQFIKQCDQDLLYESVNLMKETASQNQI